MIIAGLVVLLPLLAASAEERASWPEIDGAHQPNHRWLISGQPEPHELVAASQGGVEHVINARGIDEFDDWDQAALMDTLGMSYHRVPIATIDDLNRESIETFDRILAEIGDEPALMHCASGNRIGALFALRAAWLHNENIDAAIDIGKTHGLTGLEPAVRRLLEGHADSPD